jgi:hypothetical protein
MALQAFVDPGDRHVGYLFATDDSASYGKTDPEGLMLELESRKFDLIVVESFSLDPVRAVPQSRSEMHTSQLIAKIEMLAEASGAEFLTQAPAVRGPVERTPYWRNFCALHGRPKNRHARDAALHYVYWRHLSGRGPRIRIGPLDGTGRS